MDNLVKISGRWVLLTPFLESETELVLSYRNSYHYRNLCSKRKNIITLDDFKAELLKDFATDRHEQYIIKKKDLTPIGTIFSYNYDPHEKYIFLTTYLCKEYRNSIFGVEAHILMLRQIFERFSILRVYCDVYSYNTLSFKIMEKAGYTIEKVFKNKAKNLDETKGDIIRMVVGLDDESKLLTFSEKITKSNFKILSYP